MSISRIPFGLLLAIAVLFHGSATVSEARETKKEEADKYMKVLKTSKDNKARIEALKGLGELSQVQVELAKPAVPLFVEAIKDKDTMVRAAAAENYGKIDLSDKSDQLKALIDMVKNDKEEKVKEAAAKGLGAMGSDAKEAIPTLREAAKAASSTTKNGKAPPYYGMVMQQINGSKK